MRVQCPGLDAQNLQVLDRRIHQGYLSEVRLRKEVPWRNQTLEKRGLRRDQQALLVLRTTGLRQVPTNIVCLGDSDIEMEAAKQFEE